MISKKLIQEAESFVYSQAKKFQVPSVFHIKLSNKKGQQLAEKLGANRDIVLLGTLLMDCMLGKAVSEGKISEHVEMSFEKAVQFLSSFSEITSEEKENILSCVKEHHGTDSFYSLESEIVCNADCYRFVSIEGVVGGIHNGRQMNVNDLISLYEKKAEEKWHIISLDICKKELELQYKLIKQFLQFSLKN